jgi:hypothetical protein
MKQKIKVVLARTNYDSALTSWQEFKTVTVLADKRESEPDWHVIGEMAEDEID